MTSIKFYFSESVDPLHKLGEKVIREVQKTNFSHFAVGICDGHEEWIYESIFPKSRKIKKDDWLKEYKPVVYHKIDVELDQLIICIEFLETLIGKSYSIKQLFWIAFIGWFKIKSIFTNKVTLNAKNKLICTEMGYLFCKEFFIFSHEENSDSVDLNDMFSICFEIVRKTIWK